MMLGPVLNMVNGPVVGEAIKDPNNRIAKLLTTEKDDAKVIEDLYLSMLCRPPTPAEMNEAIKAFKDGEVDYGAAVAEHAKRVAALTAYEKGWTPARRNGKRTPQAKPVWTVLDVVSAKAKGGAKLTKQPDGSILATGPNPFPETYTLDAKVKLTGVTAIRLEALPDASLPAQGPGRAPNGNFVLNEFKVAAKGEGRGRQVQAGRSTPRSGRFLATRLGGGRRHRRQRSDGLGGDRLSSASRIRPSSS